MTGPIKENYDALAKTFHWGIALLIFLLLGVGLYMTDLTGEGDNKFFYYRIHKATGVIVLGLVLLRLLWKWVTEMPSMPAELPKWLKISANSTHFILYGMMILMPLSGILMSSFGGHPIDMFGLFTIPALGKSPNMIASISHDIHVFMVYFWIAFLTLHIGAALYHHFWRRDRILKRMLP